MYEWSLLLFTLALHIAVGGMVSLALVDRFGSVKAAFAEVVPFCAVAVLGSFFSLSHLGDMPGAYRALFNPGSSWLSKEAWSAAAFIGTTCFCTLQLWRKARYRYLLIIAACFGLFAVFASSAVYADTVMEKWKQTSPFMEFYGTAFLLGPVLVSVLRTNNKRDMYILSLLFACGVILFILNAGTSGGAAGGPLNIARFALAAVGIAAVFFSLGAEGRKNVAVPAVLFLTLGEGIGRYIFFMVGVE
jgi:DMSO reductase anchor subunit